MATNQSPPNTYQVLWHSQNIQKYIETHSDTQCDLQGYTRELLTLDLTSTWMLASTPSSCETQNRQVVSSEDDAGSKHERTESDPVDRQQLSVTTLGFLLLATITFQNKSDVLKQTINKLISESRVKQCFQTMICNNPQLKKLGVAGLQSFVNFCIGHCMLCDSDGHVVKYVGILEVWCSMVGPLTILLERLINDHIESNEEWTLPLPEPSNVSSLRTYLKEQTAAIYARFHSYDFSHDAQYQAGVQQIMRQLQSEGAGRDSSHGDLELEAKLFYFTRFVNKVNKEDYQSWLSHQEDSEKKASCKLKKPLLPGATHSGNTSPSVPSTAGLLVGQSEEHVPSKQTSSNNDGGMNTTLADGDTQNNLATNSSISRLTSAGVSTMLSTGDTPSNLATKSNVSLPLQDTPQQHASSVCIKTIAHETQTASVSLSSPSASIQPQSQSSDHLPSAKTLVVDSSEVSVVQREEASSALSSATPGVSSEAFSNIVPHSTYSDPDLSSNVLNSDLQPMNSGPAAMNADPTHTNCVSSGSSEHARTLEQNNLRELNSDPAAVNSDPCPMNSDSPPYPASFLEILRLVESGQEIPGIEVLDIEPTGAPVSESKMEPVKKPWMK